MAAFPFHDFPFTLDTALFPNSAIEMSGFLQEELNATSFPLDPSDSLSEIVFPQTNHESSCFGNGATAAAPIPVVDNLTPDSSSLVVEADGSDHMAHQQTTTVRRRKNRDWTCSNSAQSKEAKGGRRQKKCSDSLKEAEDKEPKADKKCQKKASEEPPTGYIHVRARRGQATDSHSLAERVRREKISERMKMLQALVPGCDRVIGKALVLDEIINYVRSLQNQVEFLSMKLACYGFGMDVEDCIIKSKVPGTALPLLCVQQSNPNQPTAFQEPTELVFPMRSNYASMDGSDPVLLQGQRPTDSLQENSNRAWEMDFRGEDSSNQAPYSNMYSFQ